MENMCLVNNINNLVRVLWCATKNICKIVYFLDPINILYSSSLFVAGINKKKFVLNANNKNLLIEIPSLGVYSQVKVNYDKDVVNVRFP